MKLLTLENLPVFMDHNPHWWRVNLLPEDCKLIEDEARNRMKLGQQRGWHSKTTGNELPWKIVGAAGEYAAGLMYNIPWKRTQTNTTLQELRSGDLGDFIEIKTRKEGYTHAWDLIVNVDQIYDDRVYVLTLGALYPKWVVIVGYAWGSSLRHKGKLGRHNGNGHEFVIFPRDSLVAPIRLFDEISHRRRACRSKS